MTNQLASKAYGTVSRGGCIQPLKEIFGLHLSNIPVLHREDMFGADIGHPYVEEISRWPGIVRFTVNESDAIPCFESCFLGRTVRGDPVDCKSIVFTN